MMISIKKRKILSLNLVGMVQNTLVDRMIAEVASLDNCHHQMGKIEIFVLDFDYPEDKK